MHHLDPNLLNAVLEGDLPAKLLVRQLLAHLRELCPECEQVLGALQQGSSSEDAAGLAGPGLADVAPARGESSPRGSVAVVGRAADEAEKLVRTVRRERRLARKEVSELLRAPAEERAKKVERAQTRFRSRAVAEMLLEESRRLIREEPKEAENLAALVPQILLWTPGALGQTWARELEVRALAWRANALRVRHEYRAAERAFLGVRAKMARELVGEEVHAEVASLTASLRLDQGRLEEARRLLDEAATLFRAAREEEALARVLTKRAILEGRMGDLAAAARVQKEAMVSLTRVGDERRLLEAVINTAFYQVESGEPQVAAATLAKHATALEREGMWSWPQAQTVRGRIAFALGDHGQAEELFQGARSELIRRGDPVHAAVASLDLATLYLAQGRCIELRRMARLMGSIFDAAELGSEALAAVVLFQKAVEQESVTVAAIRAWRRQLEVVRPGRGRKMPS